MRRLLAAMVLLLLLAPKAWAQGYLRQPVQPASTTGQTATQGSYDTATLLALYMSQLASSGKAPAQADIDEAARQYFTNGAAVSTVPTSGPGAAYFQNGAAAMSYGGAPVSTVQPPAAPVPPATVNVPAPVPVPQPVPVPVNVPDDTATPATAAPDTPAAAGNTSPGATEAQGTTPPTNVLASAPAPAAAPVQPVYQTIVLSTPMPAPGTDEPESALQCAPGPSLLSRLAPAFGGLFFGGLAVALWTRPRMLRDSAARSNVARK